jgi:glucose-6-phosphate 1-dehydrogenase
MNPSQSDALVFFGATGDLADKKIFPSLQARLKRGNLDVPVIGVAKAGWTLDQMRARARDSLEKHGGLDPAAFAKLSGLRRYEDTHGQEEECSSRAREAAHQRARDARDPALRDERLHSRGLQPPAGSCGIRLDRGRGAP